MLIRRGGRSTGVIRQTLTLAAALGALGAAPSAADPLDPRPGSRAKVSSYGGVTAYSIRRRDGRYRLVVARSGEHRAVTARVPSRRMPFDVDVGPDRSGRPVLVYSRCRQEPSPFGVDDGPTARWFRARGCDLFRYDPVRRHESRIPTGSSDAGSEFLPSIWRGRLAFTRRLGDGQPQIRRASLKTGRTVAVAGSFPGRSDDNRHPESLDARGTRIAVVWTYLDERRGCVDDDELRLDPVRTYIFEVVGGGRAERQASGCETTTEAARVSGAGYLADGRLYWSAERIDLSKSLVTVARAVVRTRGTELLQGPEQPLTGTFTSLVSSTAFGAGLLSVLNASFVTFDFR